jgi:hypothetical protein
MLSNEERISKLASGIARMAITVVVLLLIVRAFTRSRRKNVPPKIEQR